jgi:hypothetical protein
MMTNQHHQRSSLRFNGPLSWQRSPVLVHWATRPVVNLLEVPWIEFLAYALVPVVVTFLILYRSCWHREIAGARRTCSLLLLSCVILGGVMVGSGFLLYLAMFGFNALSGGNH